MAKSKDLLTPLLFMALSIAGLFATPSMNALSLYFPLSVLILMLGLSMIYLIATLRGYICANEESDSPIITKETSITAGSILFYIAFIWLLGFLLASILFLLFMIWYLQGASVPRPLRFKRALIASVVIALFFFCIFRYVLLVPLPVGIFFS